ncbi:MAG: D-2-hydroxyacid dehydrogenase [Chloroflexota bacterium]|nr:MAG: D-2-hydroxyacid dehydrogenase [Chloroflexota bacterium]
MTHLHNEPIYVVVAMDFSDQIIDELRSISPQLQIERHFPKVPDKVWEKAEVLYTSSIVPDPAQAPRLRWIQLNSAGVDHLADHPVMKAEDVIITSASGIHAVQISEYCLGMMLAFNYKIPTMLRYQARSEWRSRREDDESELLYLPHELRGQTLGIAGYGSIGRELARMARALGMKVLATKRDLMNLHDDNGYREPGTGDPTGDIPDRLYPSEALGSMARECDFLVLTLPNTQSTRHCVNAEIFQQMKPNAVLINVGRGSVVDEDALIEALRSKKIAGAALDVFEEEPLPPTSPLWKLDNVIISPHISGLSVNYHRKAAALFSENLRRYIDNRPLLNRVDRASGY